MLKYIITQNLKPMTISELNTRIDKSEKDFENGDFVKAEDLLAKYEK